MPNGATDKYWDKIMKTNKTIRIKSKTLKDILFMEDVQNNIVHYIPDIEKQIILHGLPGLYLLFLKLLFIFCMIHN